MAFKMRGFSAFNMNGNTDGQDIEPTKKQKRQGRRQRNKYNKKALENNPLSEAQINNLTKQINNPNTSKESTKEFKKLLSLNEKAHRKFLREQRESKVKRSDLDKKGKKIYDNLRKNK